MAKIDVLDITGKSTGNIEIPDSIFAIVPHKQAIFDAVTMQRAAMRQGTHSTKGRAEVAGGGRKP